MAMKPLRVIARHDVVITRFTYDDGTFQLRVIGPRYKTLGGENMASPDDTMEFLVNAMAFMIGVLKEYRDDLDADELEEMVKESIEDAIENNVGGGFEILWPKGNDGMPPMGGATPTKP